MPMRLQEKQVGVLAAEDGQHCARGWQDYMIETEHYMDEPAVIEALKVLDEKLLDLLGLEEEGQKRAA